jgi:maltooligosyltrehalose trehalohydrolase
MYPRTSGQQTKSNALGAWMSGSCDCGNYGGYKHLFNEVHCPEVWGDYRMPATSKETPDCRWAAIPFSHLQGKSFGRDSPDFMAKGETTLTSPRTSRQNEDMKPRSARILSRNDSAPAFSRKFPIGAEVVTAGGVHFRVWATVSKAPSILISARPDLGTAETTEVGMEAEPNGYFAAHVPSAHAGSFYKFKLDGGCFPDPVSRFQPEGPHGASQIVDFSDFQWTDIHWRGRPREGQIIYEMHIGTFTPEGTYASAMAQLPELARLGVTTLEIMPLAEFPGAFGWGYDGVDLFAPTRLYGTPDGLRAFVNRAHELGLAVILDVVYNHIGPDGNYLKQFSPHYFTDRHKNEWGQAINFDDKHSGPVREFFTTNAAYWIEEFHFDGLRLDATQQIYDCSNEHILTSICRAVREAANGRQTFIVAENECQHSVLARPVEEGGYGLDAIWSEDFHHTSIVALTGKNEAYYSDFEGSPQELLSSVKHGFLFQGQWFNWQERPRGQPSNKLHPAQFVTFLENHDQVPNSMRGFRLWQLTSPGRLRAMTTVLLLGPGTPMLLQGQEFGSTKPFYYFADHNPELAKLVWKGRREFLSQFKTASDGEMESYYAAPESGETFKSCILDFSERDLNSDLYQLHRDLIRLRRTDPVFSSPRPNGVDGAVIGPEAFIVRLFGERGEDRLLLVNLGRDIRRSGVAEPLMAPPSGREWKAIFSSDSPCYGGHGTAEVHDPGKGFWNIPGQAAVVLQSIPNKGADNGRGITPDRACDSSR